MKIPQTRRLGRELALQVLFQQEFSPTLSFQEGLDTFRGNFQAPDGVWNYAELLLVGINGNKNHIDDKIQSNSSNWTLERMALVDLNIMRIAVYEICFSNNDIPSKTAINEAVEISKKYGSTDSGAFINGILDQIHKSL